MSTHIFEFIEDVSEYTAVVYAVEEEEKRGVKVQLSREPPKIETHQHFSTIELIKQRILENPENYYSWHIVGYGNRKHTQNKGFRNSCGTQHFGITSTCNKFDCSKCFLATANNRAKQISEKILSYRNFRINQGYEISHPLHIILSPNPSHIKRFLNTLANFKVYKKVMINTLKNMGVHTGIISFHLWSIICFHCGESRYECSCEQPHYAYKSHPHFHCIGMGYIENIKNNEYTPSGMVMINAGNRDNPYYPIFYILSHASIWEKENGNLSHAYD